ncbi:MAG TPA: M23 family metallopeptidase [Terriglobia bacterium]|jgi:murein DD-endopeptidase MepM/ murein hydrolase activator NlpD
MGKRFYTFIIVPNASSRLHKLRLPVRALYLLGVIGILSFFVTIGLGFNYAKMAFKAADYDKLQAENTNLRVQKKNLEVATRKLGEKITNLETISEKIQNLIENDSMTNRGKLNGAAPAEGGSRVDYPTAQLLGAMSTKNGIELLKGQTSELEEHFSMLQEVAQQRAGRWRITPNIWPVKGPITSHFGSRSDPFNGEAETHLGVDISALYAAQVHAPADGRVIYAQRMAAYGNLVIIDHGNGLTTRYGHLSRFIAKVGQKVKKNDVIALVGTTGRTTAPHLHYEVRLNDRPKNPRDYLPKG